MGQHLKAAILPTGALTNIKGKIWNNKIWRSQQCQTGTMLSFWNWIVCNREFKRLNLWVPTNWIKLNKSVCINGNGGTLSCSQWDSDYVFLYIFVFTQQWSSMAQRKKMVYLRPWITHTILIRRIHLLLAWLCTVDFYQWEFTINVLDKTESESQVFLLLFETLTAECTNHEFFFMIGSLHEDCCDKPPTGRLCFISSHPHFWFPCFTIFFLPEQ